jgi:hypothetical protein
MKFVGAPQAQRSDLPRSAGSAQLTHKNEPYGFRHSAKLQMCRMCVPGSKNVNRMLMRFYESSKKRKLWLTVLKTVE